MEKGDKQRAERGYETDAEEDDLAVSGKPLRMVRVPAHVIDGGLGGEAAAEAAADTKVADAEPSIEDPSPDQLRAAAAAASAAAAADGTAPAHACVNPIPALLKVKSLGLGLGLGLANPNPNPNPNPDPNQVKSVMLKRDDLPEASEARLLPRRSMASEFGGFSGEKQTSNPNPSPSASPSPSPSQRSIRAASPYSSPISPVHLAGEKQTRRSSLLDEASSLLAATAAAAGAPAGAAAATPEDEYDDYDDDADADAPARSNTQLVDEARRSRLEARVAAEN